MRILKLLLWLFIFHNAVSMIFYCPILWISIQNLHEKWLKQNSTYKKWVISSVSMIPIKSKWTNVSSKFDWQVNDSVLWSNMWELEITMSLIDPILYDYFRAGNARGTESASFFKMFIDQKIEKILMLKRFGYLFGVSKIRNNRWSQKISFICQLEKRVYSAPLRTEKPKFDHIDQWNFWSNFDKEWSIWTFRSCKWVLLQFSLFNSEYYLGGGSGPRGGP